jgi:hypothetical protein
LVTFAAKQGKAMADQLVRITLPTRLAIELKKALMMWCFSAR